MGSACSRGTAPPNMPSAPAGNRGSEPGTSDSSGGTPADRDSSGGNADTGRSSPHLSIDVSGEDARPSKAGSVASLLLSKKGLDETTTTTPTADSISPASLIDGCAQPSCTLVNVRLLRGPPCHRSVLTHVCAFCGRTNF